MEENKEKLFYTIGEVAAMFRVNTSLIRFWENEFDMIQPRRNKKGNRLFSQKDVACFRQIYYLVKEKGYTLQGAKEQLRLKDTKPEDPQARIAESLQKIKILLTELKELC